MRTHQLTVSPAYRSEDPPAPKQQRCTGEKDSVLAGEMQLAETPQSCRSRGHVGHWLTRGRLGPVAVLSPG